jgi:alkane 1-monooxygenase
MSHELGHRINKKGQVWAAKFVIACSGYGHFNIEHNKGHHKHVATPEDPASARMGESLYKFARRELPGAFFRAWQLESTRLARLEKSAWSLQNEIIHSWLITLVGFSAMVFAFGIQVLPFLIITSFYGWFQLTMANYIEHYGLLRQKLANGRYQRCEPKHSWNSNFRVSNLISLHLQRHSDHHANPTRPYQLLRDYPEAPAMPTGYPSMMMLSAFPPLWYWVMDRKVVAWANGNMNLVNMDASAKDKLFARYHKMPETDTTTS